MPQDQVKALRAENKRLQCSVSKLTGTSGRSEVATLHQACAKNKRARIVCAQRLCHFICQLERLQLHMQPPNH